MVAHVGFPAHVPLDQIIHRGRAKQAWVIGRATGQGVEQQRPERTAQPVMRRNIESHLLPPQNRRRQLVPHELFQNNLLIRSPYLELVRQSGGKFHDAMIKERWPHFE